MIEKLVYFVGMPRSGSSWIASWLSEHPKVTFLDEPFLAKRPTNDYIKPHHLRQFWNLVYETYATNDRSVVVDKSPNYVSTTLRLLREVFPETYPIITVRDGKNFVYSCLNMPWGSSLSASGYISMWNDNAKAVCEKIDFRRSILVRYEDLLLYPSLSQLITSFIEIDHHHDIEPWKKPQRSIHTSYDPNRWKTLHARILRDMERMNPFLERLGYETI